MAAHGERFKKKIMKITIEVDQDLKTLKTCYRNYYGYDENKKIAKSDLANFIGNLVSADLQDLEEEGNED